MIFNFCCSHLVETCSDPSSSEPRITAQLKGIRRGQGRLKILHGWSGRIGGWCAVQASVNGLCECAVCGVGNHT